MDITITLIVQGLGFFVIAWAVMKWGWPPRMGAIEERQRQVASGLAAAERGQAELVEANTKADEIIREARAHAAQIVDQAGRRSNEMVAEARGNAQAEAARVVSHAQSEIAAETSRARDALKGQVASLAVKGAAQLLKREVDANTHAALLEELAAEIGGP
jgi:F-type H+-transporting ATPase subunit b